MMSAILIDLPEDVLERLKRFAQHHDSPLE